VVTVAALDADAHRALAQVRILNLKWKYFVFCSVEFGDLINYNSMKMLKVISESRRIFITILLAFFFCQIDSNLSTFFGSNL
jgi:hypothetical protein